MSDIKNLMQEKIRILNEAARTYYSEGREIMPNFEYDKMYDELVELEKSSGIVLAGSPTQRVGYEVISELPKETHPVKMLSLDKTKEREELIEWLGDQEGLLSWKLDGLTIVLTYRNQKLEKAVTRGNGEVGEVVTPNARTFVNVPLTIPFDGELVLRGEAVITYADFEKINESIPDLDAKYKNPRNLCSGSVRQLNSEITAERKVRFYAFTLVSASVDNIEESVDFKNSREEQMKWIAGQGFDVVEYKRVNRTNIMEVIGEFEEKIALNPVPSDGLVLTLDDMIYSASLGTTSKFPRDSIAFKWRDQIADTTLREIEWSASRTGLINPVAIFDPVELEGTTVSRASLHNISIMEELEIGIGDTVQVYKANMIIPQIAENLTRSGAVKIPETCPVCGGVTEIHDENGVRTLYCVNPKCPAKEIKNFTHFVSRDAIDVEGLSEMTIEKLISIGALERLSDLFKLDRYRSQIINMEGFGEKSYENLISAVEISRNTTPDKFLYALGITGIGAANAKVISKFCKNDWDRIQNLSVEELTSIDGVGDVLAKNFRNYFDDEEKQQEVRELLLELNINQEFQEDKNFLNGLTFVITGSLNHYANRDELVEVIESCGGKVSGSVSNKTSYLINNDVTSNSGKNKKAKELGIPIIEEETIIDWIKKNSVG